MPTPYKHRMTEYAQQLSNPTVAGSNPAAPTSLSFQTHTSANSNLSPAGENPHHSLPGLSPKVQSGENHESASKVAADAIGTRLQVSATGEGQDVAGCSGQGVAESELAESPIVPPFNDIGPTGAAASDLGGESLFTRVAIGPDPSQPIKKPSQSVGRQKEEGIA